MTKLGFGVNAHNFLQLIDDPDVIFLPNHQFFLSNFVLFYDVSAFNSGHRPRSRTSSPQPQAHSSDASTLPPPSGTTSPPTLSSAPSVPSAVSAVSLKLPPFWPGDPELWFAQVEVQFALRGITAQTTKFSYVMASLTQEYAHEVRDVLSHPPTDDPFTHLKQQLIARLCASEQKRIRQLLSEEQLGDRTPAQFLRHLQQLRGSTAVESALLQELFMQRMPSQVRMVLASTPDLPLERQALLTVTTDRGAQFESQLFTSLLKFLGSTRIRTTSYHPCANGLVERFHRQLKAALYAQANPLNWLQNLPLVLLCIRSALKPDIGGSAAEAVYGCGIRLPGEFLAPTTGSTLASPGDLVIRLCQFAQQLRPVPPRTSSSLRVFVPDALATCTHVFLRYDAIRKPLTTPYDGPYCVFSRSDKTMKIDIKGKSVTVSMDRVTPAFQEADLPAIPDSHAAYLACVSSPQPCFLLFSVRSGGSIGDLTADYSFLALPSIISFFLSYFLF